MNPEAYLDIDCTPLERWSSIKETKGMLPLLYMYIENTNPFCSIEFIKDTDGYNRYSYEFGMVRKKKFPLKENLYKAGTLPICFLNRRSTVVLYHEENMDIYEINIAEIVNEYMGRKYYPVSDFDEFMSWSDNVKL